MAGGEHLDPIPGADQVGERHDPAVDLRAPAPVADLGVDLVGEVERRRAGGKVDDVAARGEGVDAPGFELGVERAEQGPGLVGFLAGFEELPEPRNPGVEARLRGLRPLLVPPVRRDPQLGLGVHLAGADLHLQRPAVRPDDRGVQ